MSSLSPRLNAKVNCGLWVMIMYQYMLSSYDRCTTLVEGVEVPSLWWQVEYRKSLYLLLNFAVNLKPL